MHSCVVYVPLAYVLAVLVPWKPITAQQDSLIPRLWTSYNSDNCSEVITAMASATVSTLSPRERAQAEILNGTCYFDRGDSANAFAAYTRAVVADITERPDPSVFAPDRVEMYDAARATLPVVANVELTTVQFRPLLNERIVFHYTMEDSATTPDRVSFALTQLETGKRQTLSADTERRTVVWDGRFGPDTTLVSPGQYEITVTAFDANTGRNTTLRRGLRVDAKPTLPHPWFHTLPRVPLLRPESISVRRPDFARKRRIRNKGLITGLLGSGVAVLGYALSNAAADGTSPGSFGRYAAAGAYAGGVAIGVYGAVRLFQGLLNDYPVTEIVPVPDAVERNLNDIAAYRDGVQEGIERNHLAVMSYAVQLTIHPVNGVADSPGPPE